MSWVPFPSHRVLPPSVVNLWLLVRSRAQVFCVIIVLSFRKTEIILFAWASFLGFIFLFRFVLIRVHRVKTSRQLKFFLFLEKGPKGKELKKKKKENISKIANVFGFDSTQLAEHSPRK